MQAVLDELGAGSKPRITVYNKVDLLPANAGTPPESDQAAFVSALTGDGIVELKARIGDALRSRMIAVDALVPYERGELVARARTAGDVEEHYEEGGVRVSGHLPAAIASELAAAGRRASPIRRPSLTPMVREPGAAGRAARHGRARAGRSGRLLRARRDAEPGLGRRSRTPPGRSGDAPHRRPGGLGRGAAGGRDAAGREASNGGRLGELVAEQAGPACDGSGPDGADAAWMLAQHADRANESGAPGCRRSREAVASRRRRSAPPRRPDRPHRGGGGRAADVRHDRDAGRRRRGRVPAAGGGPGGPRGTASGDRPAQLAAERRPTLPTAISSRTGRTVARCRSTSGPWCSRATSRSRPRSRPACARCTASGPCARGIGGWGGCGPWRASAACSSTQVERGAHRRARPAGARTAASSRSSGRGATRSVGELLAEVGEGSLVVMLDGIEDPFNYGQAVRALYAAGVDGLVVRRSWETALATVTRASAGATRADAHGHGRVERTRRPIGAPTAGMRVACAVADADATELHAADLTRRAVPADRRRTARRDALVRRAGRPAGADRLRARARAGPGGGDRGRHHRLRGAAAARRGRA